MSGAAGTLLHRTDHSLVVAAPAAEVFAVVADTASWPAVFGPCVHVRHLERSSREERFTLWAEVNGRVQQWTSRRTLDPARLCVRFRQERSAPPVTAMSGAWLLRPRPGRRTEVVLRHRFATADDDPASLAALSQALDRNSRAELAALSRVAGSGHPVRDVVVTFEDSVELARPARDAYDFVAEAGLWADRLPHVRRSTLTETAPGVQELAMETVTPDGASHTTRSVRVCGEGWIAFKQRVLPRPLAGHSGLWTFGDGPSGARVTARHTAVIDPAAVASVFGEGTTAAEARDRVRTALGANSRATLALAAGAGVGSPRR
ncbi:aromatase/cyclase [Streptomyces sp. UNOC14_S4]|uniref:aromatase/cyclase n=1 Tax=Streptomyces sp. UNOC14_S4 TaxID=2872340 RepID=UPI001E5FFF8B|nr:aromatase/cyclase [Streptomyces sp. UNOC14_S4]MCC3767137.1 aromatase/cyclase [Streptomyces sp. UNOC14_S4]